MVNANIIKHELFGLVVLLAVSCQVQAEEVVQDKFKFSLGGYALAQFDTTISLTDPDLGAGIAFSPEDTLGLKTDNSVLRIDGYYRFTPKHALTYSWYSIDSVGSKTIDEEFEWTNDNGDTVTVPVGAQVESALGYDIFKVGYLWSFHHSKKVELGVGGGLHIMRISANLNASATSPPGSSLQSVKTTVPLPVVSLVLKYQVTPKFHWYLQTEAFALKYSDWTGFYRDTTFAAEYRFWKNIALGAGLSSNSLELQEDSPDHKLNFTNSISGGLIYVAAYF